MPENWKSHNFKQFQKNTELSKFKLQTYIQ